MWGRAGPNAGFRVGSERANPVADQTVQGIVVRVVRRRADTVCGGVVLDSDGAACGIVTIILMWDDRGAADDGHRQHCGDRNTRSPHTKPVQHLSNTA